MRFNSALKRMQIVRVTKRGKWFHTTGPATEKDLSPNFVLVRGVE